MKNLFLASIFLLFSVTSAEAQIDSLIIGPVISLPGNDTLMVPVFLAQESGCCFAHLRLGWYQPEKGRTEFIGLAAGESLDWQFGVEEVDSEKGEVSIIGFNPAPKTQDRELIFYLQFVSDSLSAKELAIRDGAEQRLGSCDGLGGTEPVFVPAQNRITSTVAGDANFSSFLSGVDITYLVNFLADKGPAPAAVSLGDANGDCQVNYLDITYLLNYFEGRGPEPLAGECP